MTTVAAAPAAARDRQTKRLVLLVDCTTCGRPGWWQPATGAVAHSPHVTGVCWPKVVGTSG